MGESAIVLLGVLQVPPFHLGEAVRAADNLGRLWLARAQRCQVGQRRDAGSPQRQFEKPDAGVPVR
jgi:hypothetical protein